MAPARNCAFALCIVAALAVGQSFGTASAADVVVGGSSGWANGVQYAPLTANLGDTLVFNYQSGRHNVMQISTLSCSALSNGMTIAATNAATPVRVPANTTGVRYYACSVGDHCQEGQLLQVTILAAGSAPVPAPLAANAPGVSPVRVPTVAPAPAPGPGKSAAAPATAPGASGAPASGSGVTPRRLASYLMG